jgi:hypothetical protein
MGSPLSATSAPRLPPCSAFAEVFFGCADGSLTRAAVAADAEELRCVRALVSTTGAALNR